MTQLAGFALAAAFLLSPSVSNALPDEERLSTLRLSQMTFVESRGGRNELVLEAEQVYLPASTDIAQLVGVNVRMDDPSVAGGSFEMTCERGDLSLDSSDFRAEGNVAGRTGDGRRFYTAWVRYDSGRGVVSTNAPVRIVDGARTLRGRGFLYHVRDGRFVLSGGATVVEE